MLNYYKTLNIQNSSLITFKIPLNAVPNNKQSEFIKEYVEKSTKNRGKTTVRMIQHFFLFYFSGNNKKEEHRKGGKE